MGISHVAYEASSHGLDQHRAEGVPLKAAAFTNFSRDHLDYHPTMDAYFEAKMRLFDELLTADGAAVIWTDDPKSRRGDRAGSARGHRADDRRPGGRDSSSWSSRARPRSARTLVIRARRQGTYRLALPLIGAYQASNVLVAAGLAHGDGQQLRRASSRRCSGLRPVRGRLERAVISRAGAPVYVDYAHTRRCARSGDRRASSACRAAG